MRLIEVLAFAMMGTVPGVAEEPLRRILVSIPDRKLVLMENGRAVKVYPIAVGKTSTPSPAGAFTIATRLTRPTWYHAGHAVRPGPANPLGPRWIGLSRTGYGIHGTNAPQSIGKSASHGCIRMRNRDVEELFDRVRVGDPVELLEQVNKETARLFEPPKAAPEQAALVAEGGNP